MSHTKRLVVFSDLDGTLLDHDTYDFAAARPALDALRQAGVPLVLVTSKTAAEVAELRAALDNSHPFVVENGAAVFIPKGYFDDTAVAGDAAESFEIAGSGPPRARILGVLDELRAEHGFRFTGFSAMGPAGIAAATGLEPDAATRANDRAASEPLMWEDADDRLTEFEARLAENGLRCVRGGRFLHVGGRFDKGAAVESLLQRYQKLYSHADVLSVALGDGPNDLRMLAVADTAVVIRGRHEHAMPLPAATDVIRPDAPGPAGWNEAILRLLAAHPGDQYDTGAING